MASSSVLTLVEVERKADLEITAHSSFEAAHKNVWSGIEALKLLRDERLYRADFDTFDAYAKAEFSIHKSQAYELIQSLEIVKQIGSNTLSTSGKPDVLPQRPSQILPLAELPENQRGDAWEAAVESANGKPPTAAQVQAVVDTLKRCPACARALRKGQELPGKCDDCKALNKKKPTALLCDGCQRDGKKKNCPACKDLRKKKSRPKQTSTPVSDTIDAYGTPLPPRCKDAYCDPWIQESIDFLDDLIGSFWAQRLANGLDKRKKAYGFFNLKDFTDGCAMVGNTLEQLANHLKEFRPVGVCPTCAGEGCSDCNLKGLVPANLYTKLKEKT